MSNPQAIIGAGGSEESRRPCRRQFAKYDISSPKGAPMDQNLTKLRRQALKTSTEFLRAQHAYLNAADLSARMSEEELKEVAEEYRRAIEPYDEALQELHQYLLAAEPSEATAVELAHTEKLIGALDKERATSSKLIEHHMVMIDQDIRLASHHVEEE
jgi:hypothetical protein